MLARVLECQSTIGRSEQVGSHLQNGVVPILRKQTRSGKEKPQSATFCAEHYARAAHTGMKNRESLTDASSDREQQAHEPKESDLLTTGVMVTFQWPPDCLWPFMDDGVEREI
jgi:hypothetical protein